MVKRKNKGRLLTAACALTCSYANAVDLKLDGTRRYNHANYYKSDDGNNRHLYSLMGGATV
jgi:hypothetical protein